MTTPCATSFPCWLLLLALNTVPAAIGVGESTTAADTTGITTTEALAVAATGLSGFNGLVVPEGRSSPGPRTH